MKPDTTKAVQFVQEICTAHFAIIAPARQIQFHGSKLDATVKKTVLTPIYKFQER
jgi:hypothetical protein